MVGKWGKKMNFIFFTLLMYLSIPIEVILSIACSTPDSWWCLVRADPRVSRSGISKLTLQDKFTTITTINGVTTYTLPNGMIHRNWDSPAVVSDTGKYQWYQFGVYARDKGKPHVVYTDGRRKWYKNGKKHRDGDLPAYIKSYGVCKWYKNGYKHRNGDKPAVVWQDGMKEWYYYGKRHRSNGPAVVIPDGPVYYYINGQLTY
jgi:predicted lipoprotein with Yx(FWY)xxD motif